MAAPLEVNSVSINSHSGKELTEFLSFCSGIIDVGHYSGNSLLFFYISEITALSSVCNILAALGSFALTFARVLNFETYIVVQSIFSILQITRAGANYYIINNSPLYTENQGWMTIVDLCHASYPLLVRLFDYNVYKNPDTCVKGIGIHLLAVFLCPFFSLTLYLGCVLLVFVSPFILLFACCAFGFLKSERNRFVLVMIGLEVALCSAYMFTVVIGNKALDSFELSVVVISIVIAIFVIKKVGEPTNEDSKSLK